MSAVSGVTLYEEALLVRTDGSTLLIGSQRPRELLSALARAGVPTQDSLPADIREF